MGVINSISETSSKAVDSAQDYVKITKKYYKLRAFKEIAKSFSFLGKMAVIGGLFFLGFVFLVVAGTIWLGKLLGDAMLGCLAMAGLLFLFTLICYLLRKQIDKVVIRKIAEEFFD
ncbi:hypothetical protein GCM10022393_01500 [Aquimarina addita]|uniref:Superfamily III holin-X n=1 Tax=Aquimarina addita TaxID=870485 RepID=A0ABP7X866_9FLAO